MKPLTHPATAHAIAKARDEAIGHLARAVDCRPSEIVVKDVRTITFAHRLETPDGSHHALVNVATVGAYAECFGPKFDEEAAKAAASAAPPDAPAKPPQADGGA